MKNTSFNNKQCFIAFNTRSIHAPSLNIVRTTQSRFPFQHNQLWKKSPWIDFFQNQVQHQEISTTHACLNQMNLTKMFPLESHPHEQEQYDRINEHGYSQCSLTGIVLPSLGANTVYESNVNELGHLIISPYNRHYR